jgi:hypothetical protein
MNRLDEDPLMTGQRWFAHALSITLGALGGLYVVIAAAADAPSQQRAFPSAEAAATALVQAVKANDQAALSAMFGPDGSKLLDSGDPVADAHGREAFAKAWDEANKLVRAGDARVTLVVGKDEWPLPIPLVRQGDRWTFDTRAGEDEILKRRIGRNELDAMKVCLAIVEAQREYAAHHLDHDGVPVYAARFVSRPGHHDGLYWPVAQGPSSPLGALLAAAADEGYVEQGALRREPYHGYYYRILTRQGQDAAGGARDYLVKGKLIGGFAVLAYPARWGASGLTTFIASDDGTIYARDFGADTQATAQAVTEFNPDSGWKREQVAQAKPAD